ncbi:hypothetical protein G4Y79_11280 [Phototrophicus methaneseepsis]|uniref:Uncharacterized protein n=1 Tax=Phototrophicus methaneseepsis TaxID=2710758 RepID=A0A7S8EDE4_9CHLR|nr:hypothetical protein [Phototrophicus methaneseepsis]QPC84920.1 hypothetical protein G4Y79_11280 [Phototrophicus methaneseepsis]
MIAQKSTSHLWIAIQRFVNVVALLCLLLAVLDFVAQVTPEQVLSGRPFWYWGYVNHHLRPPFALVIFVLLVVWGFLWFLWQPLRLITWLAAALFALACGIFTLLTPVRAFNTSAVHLESASYDGRVFHLLYQSEGIFDETCVHVLVVCDGLGLICEHVDHWQYGALCMGQHALVSLSELGVVVDGDVVLRWDRLP